MMIILIPNTDSSLKTKIATTPRLSPSSPTLPFYPSIHSLLHLRLPKRFGTIWPNGILLLMAPMSISWDLNGILLLMASLLHRHPLSTIGQALAELRSEETRKKTMASH
ncbi:hypothetical protein Acr_00g0056660 [Actinidia rufa]|uniref:Uncharacterized protein n=1 Tax=Actinidia rufa TaxID=165716 RepID=A0A7J0DMJ3_9ERIC|nr:hypothetical protein Acr_00g0056660 [Actinidia rufa]